VEGVNKEIYAYTFELLTGRRAEHPAQTDGRTEPEIMINMLLAHGIEPTRGHSARIATTVRKADWEAARIFPPPQAHRGCGSLGPSSPS
jgi:hypothetical protein